MLEVSQSVYDIPRPTVDGIRAAITNILVNEQPLFVAVAIHEDFENHCAAISVSMPEKAAFETDLTPGLAERLIRDALVDVMPAALQYTVNIKLADSTPP